MKRILFHATRTLAIAAAFCCISAIFAPSAQAQGLQRVSNRNDLFYNFYVGPSNMTGGIPAQLYPSPIPTPPIVGHTYITYPALMPHEFLYIHSRHYYRHNPGGGWSHTTVRYH